MNLNKLATVALAIGVTYVRDKLIESPIGGLISEVEDVISYIDEKKESVISIDDLRTYEEDYEFALEEKECIENCFEDEYEYYYEDVCPCYQEYEEDDNKIVVRKLFKNR
ncbi:hypothetical protein V6O07_07170 [Arthrospira platensis SPKY2]